MCVYHFRCMSMLGSDCIFVHTHTHANTHILTYTSHKHLQTFCRCQLTNLKYCLLLITPSSLHWHKNDLWNCSYTCTKHGWNSELDLINWSLNQGSIWICTCSRNWLVSYIIIICSWKTKWVSSYCHQSLWSRVWGEISRHKVYTCTSSRFC